MARAVAGNIADNNHDGDNEKRKSEFHKQEEPKERKPLVNLTWSKMTRTILKFQPILEKNLVTEEVPHENNVPSGKIQKLRKFLITESPM